MSGYFPYRCSYTCLLKSKIEICNTVIGQIVQYMCSYCQGSQIHMNNAGGERNQPQEPTARTL